MASDNDGKEKPLTAKTLADELYSHTIDKCLSFKCPKRDRWLMPARLADYALTVTSLIAEANDTSLKPGPGIRLNYEHRHQCQIEAHGLLSRMENMLEQAVRKYDYRPSEMRYWSSLISRTKQLLTRWMKSDDTRFLELTRELDE